MAMFFAKVVRATSKHITMRVRNGNKAVAVLSVRPLRLAESDCKTKYENLVFAPKTCRTNCSTHDGNGVGRISSFFGELEALKTASN